MKLFQHAMIALATSTLLYGRLYRNMTDINNRMFEMWSYRNAVALTLSAICLALVFFVVYQLASRTRWKSGAQSGFVFLISFATFYLLAGPLKAELTLWTGSDFAALPILAIILFAPIVLALSKPTLRIPYRISRLALVISPIFLILTYQLFTMTRYDGPAEKFKTSFAPRGDANPVFIFIFDEWSYPWTMEVGKLRPFFTNLEQFRSKASTFHHAISASDATVESVPRFLYQKADYQFKLTEKGFVITNPGEPRLARSEEHLFKLARAREYNTAFFGFHIHQRSLLGEECDFIETNPTRDDTGGVIGRIVLIHCAFIQKGVDAGIILAGKAGFTLPKEWIPKTKILRYFPFGDPRQQALKIEALFHEHVPKMGPNAFVVTHIIVPHAPFVFKPDGSERLPERFFGGPMPYDEDGYNSNLGYLDNLVSRFLHTIEKNYGVDRSTIIFTSDHSWRADPKMREPGTTPEVLRHVPLFIRLPNQKEGADIHEKIYLTSLRPAIEAVLDGQPERAEEALKKATVQTVSE